MCFESLINAIEEIPAGRLFRIKYSTEVELTKDAREKGLSSSRLLRQLLEQVLHTRTLNLL